MVKAKVSQNTVTSLKNAIVVSARDDYTTAEELRQLLETLGIRVVETIYQRRDVPDQRYYLGYGKVEKLKDLVEFAQIDLLAIDDEITPLQAKNLGKMLTIEVKDRTQVILEIFARHATTEEGKLQVELAKLQYELPRLIGRGKELSRLGGGIGTRGPGEQEIEEKRRKIRERINNLRQRLDQLKENRQQQRKLRFKSELPMISVVGYTNAGKSSLIRTLSKDEIFVADKLFSTLSPVIRRVKLPTNRVALFKDTVGFIRNIPHTLVEAFKSTLEEILFSDLIVLVVDISDENFNDKLNASLKVLEELGAQEIKRILVFNKIDLLAPAMLRTLCNAYPDALFVSAVKGTGIQEFLKRICDEIEKNECEDLFAIKVEKLPLLIKEQERITILEQVYENDLVTVRVKGRPSVLRRLKKITGGMSS
ncbi:GTPase HflX [Pseudothermotoga sp. U03pept]|uniref:GTPase HflX n=1 Tax=Pseudothermotoga sp. U03pept TaxID=3447012 RepID=UPI003F0B6BA3